MTNLFWVLARQIDLFPARVRVVLSAAVTWLTVAAAVAQAVIVEVGGGWPADVGVAARVVTVAGVAVAIIRRVTPVVAADRGVLPPV